jgi:hypothetical protein
MSRSLGDGRRRICCYYYSQVEDEITLNEADDENCQVAVQKRRSGTIKVNYKGLAVEKPVFVSVSTVHLRDSFA